MTNILLFARILLYTQLFESFEKLYMKKFVESIAKMEFNRKKILTVSIGIIVIGIVYYVLSRPRKAAVSEPTVVIETVTTDDVEIYGEYVGRIRAQQFVEVRARVEGYLEKMLFEEGTYVPKNQLLFIINPDQYKAKVDKVKAQLTKDKAQALKAKRDLERIQPLYAQNAASRLDLDNAIAAYER